MKAISRQAHTGIAFETTRGVVTTPTFWLPRTEYKNDDKVQKVVDESSIGVIEDSQDASITQTYSEGEIGGRVDTESIGAILRLVLGSVASIAVPAQAGAFDHNFNVLQSAQHPTFTLSVKDPNTGAGSQSYALAGIQDFELNSEINKFCEYKLKYRANSKAISSFTPAYSTTQRVFLPQGATLKLADTLVGLGVAPLIQIKKINLSIKKNLEDDQVLGNINAIDRLNKQFSVEGSFEMITDDYTYRDLLLTNGSKYAEFKLTNSLLIGASTTPSLTVTLNKIELDEVANKLDNNGFGMHTVKFKAYYNLADARMINVLVRNTTASY